MKTIAQNIARTALLLVILGLLNSAFAQVPQKISYQAVIRNSGNALVTNTSIGMRVSILQGSATGTEIYKETYSPNPSTNTNGLVTFEIGTGTAVTGTFAAIDWASGPYYIKTETDPTGGANYTIVGTSQLASVPYALFSANGVKGATGVTGEKGATGTNGTNGVTGATGTNGVNGVTGITGATGTAGVNGATGATGATGTAGQNGDKYTTTSTTSLSITTGSKSLTVATGLAYAIGQTAIISNSASNLMTGTVTAYNSASGALTVNVSSVTGSGTFTSWNVSLNGAAGPAGPTGAAGNNGVNGVTGATGTNGTNGITGATGATGINGINGVTGATGTNGTNGVTGATGTNGINGATGATGTAGINGINGITGATGTAGLNGDKYTTTSTTSLVIGTGTKSLTVGTGLAYAIGQTVIVSNSASNLMTGTVTAYNSATGALSVNVSSVTGAGTFTSWNVALNGAAGPAGPTGTNGINGINGATGATGATGTPGVNGTNGVTGATGQNGTNGVTGATGQNGLNGATGVTGPTGTGGGTLDQAYDFGGLGLGRVITADTGSVRIAGKDGFVVTGTLGIGNESEVSGDGVKMFFNPKKAAFRAGEGNSGLWNPDSIGVYSFAFGSRSLASSRHAIALSSNAEAIDTGAIAIGFNAFANGNYAMALGWNSQAIGDKAVAIGSFTESNAQQAYAIGDNSIAQLEQSFSVGNDNYANGENSFAFGNDARTNANNSFAIGNNVIANSFASSVFGRYNDTANGQNKTAWIANQRLFEIGNGTSAANVSNAMTILKNGNVGFGNSFPQRKFHIVGSNGSTGFTPLADAALVIDQTGQPTLINILSDGNNRAGLLMSDNITTNRFGMLYNGFLQKELTLVTKDTARVYITATGDVGINTTAPGARLDVAGKTRTTNLQMTTGAAAGHFLQSDANGNASWVAAFGSETDPQVSSSVTSRVPRWTGTTLSDGAMFDNATNVGIGTTTLTERLNVSGNIAIPAINNYKYATPRTKYMVLNSSAFNLAPVNTISSAGIRATSSSNGLWVEGGTSGTNADFAAPVVLPDGAVVQAVEVFVRDASNAYEVNANLIFYTFGTTVPVNLVATTNSTGVAATPNDVIISATGLSHTVDAQNNNYFLRFNTFENNGNLRIYSARITYTVTYTD